MQWRLYSLKLEYTEEIYDSYIISRVSLDKATENNSKLELYQEFNLIAFAPIGSVGMPFILS